MLRVGLVGCGAIGSELARVVERRYRRAARIAALYDLDATRALALQRRLATHPPIVPLSSLIRRSQLVVEAASADAAARVVPMALRAHRDVLVMSVGGLLRNSRWKALARRSRGTVYLPSGALAGLDGVKAMAQGRIRRVSLTTRKPPKALADAPYVRRRGLRLDRLKSALVLFDGPPRAAVEAFPQNANVAATLTLASGAPQRRVRVRIIADPAIHVNTHEVDVESDCGRIRCRTESRPSANPKTSELAVRSAVTTLERLLTPIVIGT